MLNNRKYMTLQKRTTFVEIGGGKDANLKGTMFRLICEKYIKKKYSPMLIIAPSPFTHGEPTGCNAPKIGFACENIKILQGIGEILPISKISEMAKESYHFCYPSYEYEYPESIIAKNQEKMSDTKMKNKRQKIIKNAKNYLDYSIVQNIKGFPDYIVFLEEDIHIYEFKGGGQARLTFPQREMFKKLKNSGLPIKIFILHPKEDFLTKVDINLAEYIS